MLETLGSKLLRYSYWKFCLFLFATVVIKNGIHPIGPKWIEIVNSAASKFPDAANYMSTSPLPILIMKLVGNSNSVWWLFHFTLILIWTFLVVRTISNKYPNQKRIAAALFILSPTFLVIILFIGHYDLFTIAGASIAVFSSKFPIKFVGVTLAAMANPEQGFVTAFLLLAVVLAVNNKEILQLSLIYFGVSTVVFIGIRAILNAEDTVQRSRVISGELSGVIKTSIGVWSLIPLSLVGISGITLLLLSFFVLGTRPTLLIGLAVYVIPSVFALLILDKTRVGVAIAAAPYFLVCKVILEKMNENPESNLKIQSEILGLTAILAVLYPSIYFDIDAELRLPYKELLQIFIN